MKKVVMALLMMVSFAITAKAQEVVTPDPMNPNAPVMTFESEVIDYGVIEYGSDGVRTFKFKNTGKEPLIISNAVGSCGCTTPSWPKEPIKPGETGEIKVKYDTNRVGGIDKNVTITSNASTPTKVLKIKGTVKPQNNPAPTPSPAPAQTPAPGK